MFIQIVKTIEDFTVLREAWDKLLENSCSNCIFLTWEWLYYWWINFKGNKELFIILVKDSESNRLLGIAPFFIEKSNLLVFIPIKKLRFLGTEKVASDFLDFILYPGLEEKVLKVICEYLEQIRDKWDAVEIEDVDKNSYSVMFIKKNVNGKYRLIEKKSQICPYIQLPSSYEMLVKGLSRKMRSNIKRGLKQIQNRNDVKFLIVNQKEKLKSDIDTLFSLHSKGFKKRGLKSNFSKNKIKNFHYDISNEFLSNGWLKFYFLEIENQPVASLYAFKFKNRLFYYQSGIDLDFDFFGLGTVLQDYCIKNSLDDGLCEFNFLRGDEEYKYRWTKEYKETVNILITNKTFSGCILNYSKKIKEFFKQIIGKKKYG